MAELSLGGDDSGTPPPRSGAPPSKRTRTMSPISSTPLQEQEHEQESEEEEEEEEEFEEEPLESEEEEEFEEEPQESEEEPQEDEFEQKEQEAEKHESEQTDEGEVQSGEAAHIMIEELDVLDCPICSDVLEPPVYQCENGHWACGSCCIKMRNKCPSCDLPTGRSRCRAIENVLESAKIYCQNKKYGCMVKLSYTLKLDHEKNCNYAPCSCPHLDCDYINMSKFLYRHFLREHYDSATHFKFNSSFKIKLHKNDRHLFLQEHGNTLFILNRFIESFGSLVNIVCIGPNLSKDKYLYYLVTNGGESTIEITSRAEPTPIYIEQPPFKNYLTVPNYIIDKHGSFEVQVMIWVKGMV